MQLVVWQIYAERTQHMQKLYRNAAASKMCVKMCKLLEFENIS